METNTSYNNFKIDFKSGNGESWIDSVHNLSDDGITFKKIDISDDDKLKLESDYSNLIRNHDKDPYTGYGQIVVKNGVVTGFDYNVSE